MTSVEGAMVDFSTAWPVRGGPSRALIMTSMLTMGRTSVTSARLGTRTGHGGSDQFLPIRYRRSRGLCLNCDVMTTYVDKAFANYNPPEDRGTADSEETDESQQSDSDGSDRSYDSEDDPETERLRDELQRLCSSGAGPSDAFNKKFESIKSKLRKGGAYRSGRRNKNTIGVKRSSKREDTNIGPSEFYYRYGDPIYDYDSEAQDRGSDSDSD